MYSGPQGGPALPAPVVTEQGLLGAEAKRPEAAPGVLCTQPRALSAKPDVA
jgi:hypothetical protein